MQPKDRQTAMEHIYKQLRRTPTVTDELLSSGNTQLWVDERLEFIDKVFAENNMEIEDVIGKSSIELASTRLICAASMKRKLRTGKKLLGGFVQIVKGDPMVFKEGTYKIVIGYITWAGDTREDFITVSIAYDRPVSRSEFETRWTLQIKDNVPVELAAAAARKFK